jgi:hypothetical protein
MQNDDFITRLLSFSNNQYILLVTVRGLKKDGGVPQIFDLNRPNTVILNEMSEGAGCTRSLISSHKLFRNAMSCL